MDDDMEAVEIVFAQRLASGEPNIRKRALKLLREHITEQSTKKGFTGENLARLCKGLHYALWMQDKMILQEELADQICELTTLFQKEDDVLAFAQSLFFSLSKEWPFIDRWRMDKFLMFIRRLVRTLFARLSYRNWNPDLSSKYLQSFKETMLSAHSPICESLKFHCASLWLDELDNASVNGQKLGQQQCLDFIRPYIELLKDDISDTFFRTICTDIFDTILLDFSGQLAQKEAEQEEEEEDNADEEEEAEDEDAEEEESTKGKGNEEEKVVDESNCAAEDENEENSNGLTFDFEKLSELLFDAGKQPNMPARRRKRLYALCKKFENAAKEIDPFPPLEQLPRKRRKAGRRFKK